MDNQQRSLKFAALAILIAMLLGFLILELIIRLTLPNYSPEVAKRHAIPYLSRLYSGLAIEGVDRLIDTNSASAWGRLKDEDSSEKRIYISSNGFRGPAFDVRKPAGVYRIVVLGGSSVFDQNVYDTPNSYLNSWPHQVQLNLNELGHEQVEVINAGVPGMTSADSLGRLYTQLWTYAPDMVLVYQAWNDFKLWHRKPISPETPLLDSVMPYDDTDDPFLNYQGGLDRFMSNSQLYVRMRTLYYRVKWRPSYEGATPKDVTVASEYGVYGPQQYRLNMTLIAQAASAIGAVPVIVKQATLVAADNPTTDRERIGSHYLSLEHDAIVSAYQDSYQIADEIARETGALVIDPTELMNGKSEWFTDGVHTSVTGSAELARFVAEQLVAQEVSFSVQP